MAFATCAHSQESETGNILEFSSMDGEQVIEWEAEEAQIHWATRIDTMVFYGRNDEYLHLCNKKLVSNLIGDVLDSNTLVIQIKTVFPGEEDEPTLYLYAEFKYGHLTKVYHLDVGQAPSTWKAVETYVAPVHQGWFRRVRLDAVLETIGFGLSCCIRFPYNDEGLYDNIYRYQRVHAEFEVPDEVFKLIGKASEPPRREIE